MKLSRKNIIYIVFVVLILFFAIRLVRCTNAYEYDTPKNNLKDAKWFEIGDEIVYGDWKITVLGFRFGKADGSDTTVDFNVTASCEYTGSSIAYFDSFGDSTDIIFDLIYDEEYEYYRELSTGAFWNEQYVPLEKKTGEITFEVPKAILDNEDKSLVFIIRENTVYKPLIYALKIR